MAYGHLRLFLTNFPSLYVDSCTLPSPHSNPMSPNICFSFEDITAVLLSDLWPVFRSSTKRTWVILSVGLDDKL